MLGPYQIARLLNTDTQLKTKAPSGDFWRSETVARILKNPVYYGTVVYNRRTSIGDGRTKVVNNSEWVYSDVINEDLKNYRQADLERNSRKKRSSSKTTKKRL